MSRPGREEPTLVHTCMHNTVSDIIVMIMKKKRTGKVNKMHSVMSQLSVTAT